MTTANQSAMTLRWLLDELRDPLTTAWADVRDRMRVPSGQTVMMSVDWISDPWVTRGIQPATWLPTTAPNYDPPDAIDAWPEFGAPATTRAAGLTLHRTRSDVVDALIAAAGTTPGPDETVFDEFMSSEQRVAQYGDAQMVYGEQVRAWVLASVGSLLRGLIFLPAEADPEKVAATVTIRLGVPRRLQLPESWALSNHFGDRHLELLLNLTVQDGRLAPLDPADIRVGQGIPWQQAWRWLCLDTSATAASAGIQTAARLLRSPGLVAGLRQALASDDVDERTLATGVARRWLLALRAMTWAEHAVSLPWDLVRPADVVSCAFSATRPEWPRRLLAVSHRSGDVKPQLRHMGVWKSSRCAIDATYIPAWETNTGMIWGLFSASPAIVRVRTPGYETSIWCRREAEMVSHLLERGDFFTNRVAGDLEPAQLGLLDEWDDRARGGPRDDLARLQSEFPPFGLNVWSPRPSPSWELAIQRAAGALRVLSALLQNALLVNRLVGELLRLGDIPMLPAPTNQPGGWRSYTAIFRKVASLLGSAAADAQLLRLADDYSADDMARDRAVAEWIPDLSSGTPRLEDVLVAVEFLRTTWPVMVDQGRGRFLVINLQGVDRRRWEEDPEWSLQRGLAMLRGLPVPLWFLQHADQGLSDWGLPGDPPILTEHVDAQFGWMLEAHPDQAAWRAAYPDQSRLVMSPELRRLHDASPT